MKELLGGGENEGRRVKVRGGNFQDEERRRKNLENKTTNKKKIRRNRRDIFTEHTEEPSPVITPVSVLTENNPASETAISTDEHTENQPAPVEKQKPEITRKTTTLDTIFGGFPEEIKTLISIESADLKSAIQEISEDTSPTARRRLEKLKKDLKIFEDDPFKYYRLLLKESEGERRKEIETILRNIAHGMGIKNTVLKAALNTAKPEIIDTSVTTPDQEEHKVARAQKVEKLRQVIETATKELEAIEEELRMIRARKAERTKTTTEKSPEQGTKQTEKAESEPFPTDVIRGKIIAMLGSFKEITNIKKLEVTGEGLELKLFFDFEGKIKKGPFYMNLQGKITAILENSGNSIKLDKNRYTVESESQVDKAFIETGMGSKLGELPAILKSYIEKEKGKKVSKIEIKNGQLQVTF